MTKINRMVLNGFKSFGKRTEMLFGDQFNVVLGPNGSGKSNVLDALCFVLGKSSSKSMRAEKSANLIYNGGKTKKPAKTGEVSIYFDNESKIFPTDEETVKISRIVKDTGQSIYKINDKTRTRQQVLDLLSLAKINPDGYNIILQGDIIKLIEMSTNERRQIIEEISGIGVYEEKKEKALRELEKVEEKIGEAEIILKERASYLKDLKKDRDQALKYKELNDKIKINKASYTKKQIDKRTSLNEEFQNQYDKHKNKFNFFKEKICELKQKIAEKKQHIKDISDEVESKGEKEQVAIQKEVESIRVELATWKTRISTCNDEIAKLSEKKIKFEKDNEELNNKIQEVNINYNNLKEKSNTLISQKKELQEKINLFKEKNKIGEDSEKLEKRIDEIDSILEDKEKEIQVLREQQQNFLRVKDRAEFQISTFKDKIVKLEEIKKEHKAELDIIENKRAEFKKATLELNQMLSRDSEIAQEFGSIRTSLTEYTEELARLEAKQIHIKEKSSSNIAVQKILESKSIKGIIGKASDLAEVDAKYSTALEITAGKKIHSIVVEDDLTASKCISYLKTNKLGIASFLPLNKIKPKNIHPDIKKLKNSPGAIGFAIDLVKFDSKYKDVFSHIFQDTLIIDKIDSARKIGIGKTKMVSLDGDISFDTGAMQGGFRVKKASVFMEKELQTKINFLNQKVSEIQCKLSSLQSERSDNEDKISKLREFKANLEGEIIVAEKSLHLNHDDLESSQTEYDALTKNLKETDEKLESVLEKISLKNRELANLKIEKQQLRTKLNDIRNPRVLAELNTYEQKRTEINEQLIKVETDFKYVKIQKDEILNNEKENLDKAIKDHSREESLFAQELKDLKNKIHENEKNLKKKESEQAKFHSKFKELFQKRNKISDEISKHETEVYQIEDSSRKEELKLNTISLEQTKIKSELLTLNEEFAKYEGVELDLKKTEDQLKKEINDFERMRSNIGNVNMRSLEIYDAVEKEYNSMIEKKDSLSQEKESVLSLMEEIDSKKKEVFMETYNVIAENFSSIFSQLSTKGEAHLELENEDIPFDGGLTLKVRLTGNKFMDIRSLSGGEKTMTALAFLFSIQEYEPASFYILDEVDAALDKENSEKLAKLIRKYCDKAQYIVISHHDALIQEGNNLYGISMNEHGISNVLSLKI